MKLSKRVRLSPQDRQEIWKIYQTGGTNITDLAERFNVSRPTIYKVIERARRHEFEPRKSTNLRYRNLRYGLKRLAKVERNLESSC
jgi:transposase-like protein